MATTTTAVTIHDLALLRLGRAPDDTDPITGGDYYAVGLDILGGCEICHASIAGYNAHPSRSGYWRCSECIGDDGWQDVRKANADIFGADN